MFMWFHARTGLFVHARVSAAVYEENTSTKGCKIRLKSVPALQCKRVHVQGTDMQENVHFVILVFQQPLSFYSLCLVEKKSLRTWFAFQSWLSSWLRVGLPSAGSPKPKSGPMRTKPGRISESSGSVRQYSPLRTTVWMQCFHLCGCRCIHLVRRLPHIT